MTIPAIISIAIIALSVLVVAMLAIEVYNAIRDDR